jgi:hypothetical protein
VSMAPVLGQRDSVMKRTWRIGSLTLQSYCYRPQTNKGDTQSNGSPVRQLHVFSMSY